MSYILEALRKSEEARRRQQGQHLSLTEATAAPEPSKMARSLPWLTVALLLNAALGATWLLWPEADQTAVAAGQAPAAAPAPPPAAGSETPAVVARPHAPLPTVVEEPTQTPATSAPDWRSLPQRRLADLSREDRQRFPELGIATHIYTDDPSHREISVEGRRYQEGDRIRGLPLLEITPSGVLIGFDSQVVRIELQEAWTL